MFHLEPQTTSLFRGCLIISKTILHVKIWLKIIQLKTTLKTMGCLGYPCLVMALGVVFDEPPWF